MRTEINHTPTITPAPNAGRAPKVAIIGDDGDVAAAYGHVPQVLFVVLALAAHMDSAGIDLSEMPGGIVAEPGDTFENLVGSVVHSYAIEVTPIDDGSDLYPDRARGETVIVWGSDVHQDLPGAYPITFMEVGP